MPVQAFLEVPALLVFMALEPEQEVFLAVQDLVVPALLVFIALEPVHEVFLAVQDLVVPALLVFIALEPVQEVFLAVQDLVVPALLVFIALEPLEAQQAFFEAEQAFLLDLTAVLVAGAAASFWGKTSVGDHQTTSDEGAYGKDFGKLLHDSFYLISSEINFN